MKRVYIAGPDVFYDNAQELAQAAHEECTKRSLEALCPVDNQVGPAPPQEMSLAIFRHNLKLIEQSDAVCANISPFRGPSADAGTVWEIGYAYGLGKPIVAYSSDPREYKERAQDPQYGGASDGAAIEDFGGIDNLMITHALDSVYSTLGEALDKLLTL